MESDAEYAEYEAIEMGEIDLLHFGSLPEDVRLMILSHLTTPGKLTAMESCTALCAVQNEGAVGLHLRRVRANYLNTKHNRDLDDSSEVHTFFWALFKVVVTALLSLALVGGLGLYCYYYGTLYQDRECDFPLARDLREYGRLALKIWGMLLILQIVTQSQLLYRLVPNCFKRPRDSQFFDLETGEPMLEEEVEWTWDHPHKHMILVTCALGFIFFLWITSVMAIWNIMHVFYFVIYSEVCDAELYDAAWFFCMIPVCFYMLICFISSIISACIMMRR